MNREMDARGGALRGHWSEEEVVELKAALKPLPEAWLEDNRRLHNFWRRPELINGPPQAPGHSLYERFTGSIVVFDKGVYHHGKIDPERFRRSIYHELAHSILDCDSSLLERWTQETRGDGFVDEYAKTSPAEDFCDSFSEFWLHRKEMESVAPLKVRFMTKLLTDASRPQEKTAMSFVNGFIDELVKVARPVPTGLLARLGPKLPGAAKALGLAGVAGGGAYIAGSRKGEERGVMEGLEGAEKGMQQAYMMGVQRGALEVMRRHQSARGGDSK